MKPTDETHGLDFIRRLTNRLTRRRRWEREACYALITARRAALKLRAEIQRGCVEPKAEYEALIALIDRLFELPMGPGFAKPVAGAQMAPEVRARKVAGGLH